MIRTHASFRGHFPKDRLGNDPPGGPLAELVARGLAERGYVVSDRDSTDYSHTFTVRSGERRYFAMIGVADDGDREWLLFLQESPSLLARLFGRRDEGDHLRLLRAVHDCLIGDPRIAELRWYTEQEWNSNPSGGTVAPG